ncbi:vinculin A [Heterostelium album PN500]|uniref:Vinculin A n=1 Tax=Heterostelium pallidum (strain ATCC 26659 / Pp 5 / PN500) TaxID=670386 RepID=D3B3I7_HETP5|nr:vinculin A [Heterostelium album PN500]EFA83885.1 vinculin A [Heterostelium album PN500]|eukprot:XP_020436002.1 vinculin A [Heterostelium album PN500]
MDEVLEMIADAVSSLVVAITESEEKNTLFGDMVPGVELIQQAVVGMSEAAEETLGLIDEEFKPILNDTARQLKNAANQLHSDAVRARDDPWNRVPQKDAIKSAKMILQKVVLLVLIEEQSNIKVLVGIAKKVAEGVKRIDEIENLNQLNVMVSDVAQLEDELVKRSQRRSEGSNNPEFRQRLEELSASVSSLSHQHQQAARNVCQNTGDHNARARRADTSQKLLGAIDDMIYTIKQIFASNTKFVDLAFKWQPVRTIAEDEVTNASAQLVDYLHALPKQIEAGNGPAAAREIVNAANLQISNAIVVANRCEDPIKKKMILKNIEELKKLTPQLIAAMKPVLENPNDMKAKQHLDNLIYSTQKASENLASAVISTPSEIVAASGASLTREIESLEDAINRGDIKRAEAITNNLGSSIDRHIEMATALLDSIQDPSLRHQVQKAIEKLIALKPKILEAAHKCIRNPRDEEAKRQLNQLVKEAKSAISQISQPYEVVAALNTKLHNDLDSLTKCIDAGGPDMQYKGVQHAKDIAADIKKQIEEAEAYAASISDPVHKKQIQDAVDRLKQLTPQLLEAIKDVLADPTNKAARARLDKLIGEVKDASTNLAVATQPTSEELKMQRLNREMSMAKVEQPKPAPVEIKPAPKFKIEGPVNKAVYVAAEEVANALEKKVRDDTPLGKLVSFGDDIAAQMALLSSYAAKGDVKGMIQAARKIADSIKAVQLNAKGIADACIDPRLKQAVFTYLDCGSNFSTQLKILCAVKAASDDDSTSEEQLVTCAKGLSSAVINIIKSAEAASLKLKK